MQQSTASNFPSVAPMTSKPSTSYPTTSAPTFPPSIRPTASRPTSSTQTPYAPTSVPPSTYFPSEPPFEPLTSEPSISMTNEPTESSSIIVPSDNNTTSQNSSSEPNRTIAESQPSGTQVLSKRPSKKPIAIGNNINLNSKHTSAPDRTSNDGSPTLKPVGLQSSSGSPTTLTPPSQARTSQPSKVPTLNINEQDHPKITSNPPSIRSRQDNIAASTDQEKLEGSDTTLIIMTVAGVATLTMLVIVFATQKRRTQ